MPFGMYNSDMLMEFASILLRMIFAATFIRDWPIVFYSSDVFGFGIRVKLTSDDGLKYSLTFYFME